MADATNDFLMSGGVPSASFADIGDTCKGTVVEWVQSQQRDYDTDDLLYWDDAKTQPRMQAVITLQTDERDNENDEGKRNLYVKGVLKNAVKDAIKAAGAPGLEVGAVLVVQFHEQDEPKKKGMSGLKRYKAVYKRPVLSLDDETTTAPPAAAKPVPDIADMV